LVEDLVSARSAVLEAVDLLPASYMDEIFLGSWSVKDLLAHLVGWDVTNLQAVQGMLSALLAEVDDSHRQLVAFLRGLGAEELVNGKARNERGNTVTIRTLLRAEASDELKHARQVSEFFAQRSLRPD
jgi:hypothetical protein